jgi:hypothetical protein
MKGSTREFRLSGAAVGAKPGLLPTLRRQSDVWLMDFVEGMSAGEFLRELPMVKCCSVLKKERRIRSW